MNILIVYIAKLISTHQTNAILHLALSPQEQRAIQGHACFAQVRLFSPSNDLPLATEPVCVRVHEYVHVYIREETDFPLARK